MSNFAAKLAIHLSVRLVSLNRLHFWILPNLSEDVGLLGSFWPLFQLNSKRTNVQQSSPNEPKALCPAVDEQSTADAKPISPEPMDVEQIKLEAQVKQIQPAAQLEQAAPSIVVSQFKEVSLDNEPEPTEPQPEPATECPPEMEVEKVFEAIYRSPSDCGAEEMARPARLVTSLQAPSPATIHAQNLGTKLISQSQIGQSRRDGWRRQVRRSVSDDFEILTANDFAN